MGSTSPANLLHTNIFWL